MDMVKIEILGTGCKKCQQLESNAKQAVANMKLTAEVLHITDPVEIAMRGVMSTPAMTINGKVVCKGQVISPEQIQPLLQS
ncbi:MAG: thioredoxin family protein [Pseudanabaena sp.]|jgi:small redox-active disulfide protein 2|nr:thioredoxin family protein [Pseudanabaena sp. M090S1SP2A07QC]MCA6505877.1 thioredoxin family protein [Pseudanabaena sp. M172S2SP2A07QC]MCA6511022.1 thioredoxin family protein [Pseudanabaena sp. M109S1SP2A07QC]MCA6521273.1 thioredoxin family protein [Pseudanabaena sp. M051S1SP2A07QC]MCA6525048.1 thioredoxin family protein [Pseudanabaena sp. M179S2SP2A07QC]MCA6529542.1 thioredoxin family protein [Pseudanabaena sp. M125S2SP2A07QC]MCA6534046.1 thioredoxin family protein [Pseudanabaena sp. M176